MKSIVGIFVFLCIAALGVWLVVAYTPSSQTGEVVASVVYQCDGGKTIGATYYDGGPAPEVAPGEPPVPTGSVAISIDGAATTTLHQTISASGVRYANQDESLVFWNKGDEALIMRNNQMDLAYTNCKAVSPLSASDVECHDGSAYAIVTRSRDGEVGQDILIKKKSSSSSTPQCVYQKEDGDIELAEDGPTYALALIGEYLLLDSGTAPFPRGLAVYDISKQKEVYTDRYNGPTEAGEHSYTYWQPVDTKPTATNCPELAQWEANGLGAGIERHVTLDLSTLKVQDLGEMRCSGRQ